MGRGWKSRGDRRDFSSLLVCLVGRMEKWRNKKFIFLVEKKMRGWKSKVGINLQLCPH